VTVPDLRSIVVRPQWITVIKSFNSVYDVMLKLRHWQWQVQTHKIQFEKTSFIVWLAGSTMLFKLRMPK